MKAYVAGSVILMLLFLQCSMNLTKQSAEKPKSNHLVNLEANDFIHPEQIGRFLERLNQLKASNGDSLLTIIHIGDSHIQMGYFSSEVRNTLQARFGGQGIGFFFPNSLCSGFNPVGLDISSPSNWQCEKITNLQAIIPLGVIGMGMKTDDRQSVINVSLKGRRDKVRTFKVFHANVSQTHDISCEDATVETQNFSDKSAVTIITMQAEADTAFVKFTAKEGTHAPLVVYGLSVNTPARHGVNFNTFGVSGGQYKYFALNTPLLAEQMKVLQPDLMIISLGSNDAYVKDLKTEEYTSMVSEFVAKLRAASPKTDFILTTPPDTKFKDSRPASGNVVYQSIIDAGKQSKCAVWDFYKVMGGFGSVRSWKKEKLGNKDGLHLTTEGYYLQGQLFNLALARALEQKYPGNGWLEETEQTLVNTMK